MSSASEPAAIGFPPPLLGPSPLRLPILAQGKGWLALEKPTGVLADAHPWYPQLPCLVAALRRQVAAGKPELQRLGLSEAHTIAFLDPEISGPALLATDRKARNAWRNRLGSYQLSFSYRLLVATDHPAADGVCELPLHELPGQAAVRVSHRHGKQAQTVFRCLQRWQYFEEWEARLAYPRPHQVRLHASEWGLHVWGEAAYAPAEWPHRLPSGVRRLAPAGLGIRLAGIECTLPDSPLHVLADEPKRWHALKRQLAKSPLLGKN